MKTFTSIRQIFGALAIVLAGALPTATQAQSAATTKETLTYAVNTFGGEVLDPIVANAQLINILSVMFDSLFDVDVNGQFTPGLVTKWEASADAKMWTLHLREGVTFHDGSPFTAEDVVYSIEHAQAQDAIRGGLWRETLGTPPKIETPDKYTVRVTTPTPQPHLPAFMAHVATPFLFVLPKAYIDKNGIDYFRKHPVGTGPYKFVSLVPGREMTFEAVEYKHWRVTPNFQTVKILEVPEETTRVAMIETGQADASTVTLENAARLQKQGMKLALGDVVIADLNFVGTYLPEAKGMPLADVRVRQALSLAINRKELVDTLLGGVGSADVVNIVLDWTTPDWTPELVAK